MVADRGDGCINGTPPPPVVEIAAAETTVEFSTYITHAAVVATTITIEISETTSVEDNSKVTPTVNGQAVADQTLPWSTTFFFDSTTLSLSFSARQTAFVFTGEATTEVTIPSEHTHITIDGIETAIDLPGLTTTLTVSSASNVIVSLPEVTTTLEFTAESYVFSVTADTIDADSLSMCGTYTFTGGNGEAGSTCLPGISTVITLPSAATASELYLNVPGLTTSFLLPGITTTFVPEQTITIVKDGSTETSVIPAVVSTYVTPSPLENIVGTGIMEQ